MKKTTDSKAKKSVKKLNSVPQGKVKQSGDAQLMQGHVKASGSLLDECCSSQKIRKS
jgi:hypothetical protein